MAYFDGRDFEQARIEAKRNLIDRPPPTVAESFFQDLGLFWRETWSISRDIAVAEGFRERAQKVREVAGDKAFIKAITLPGDPSTQQMIAELAAEHEEIKPDSVILSEIKERNRILREERDKALQYQTLGGKVGGFFGTMVGAITDPLVLMTLPLGAPLRGISVLRAMAIEAGIGAGTEALIQGPILRYKKELESPYDLGDAVTNIAGAGLGAAGLTGIVRATMKAIGRAGVNRAGRRVEGFDELLEAGERIPQPTGEQQAAMREVGNVAEALRQSPFERVHPELDELHLNAIRKAEDDLLNKREVDVSEFVEQPKIPEIVTELPPREVLPSRGGAIGRVVDDIDPEEALSEAVIRERVRAVLAEEDVSIRVEVPGGAPDARGEIPTMERPAREVLQSIEDDIEAGNTLTKCLLGN